MDYQTFATALSLVLVAMYGALTVIAVRRATRHDGRTELIAIHARRVEGPLFSVLLVVALLLTISATHISSPDAAIVIRLALGATRGALVVVGLYLLAWSWTARDTWL